ncbi:MAG: DUF167 domain-containing protein [Candidatus Rokuibacteriota bacterium]|nr:MAG: DUF167 domain-containing protein [Candidatus Rokubacteria bacterium]
MTGAAPPAARLRVRVEPRASRDEVVGWREETLRLRVSAPPLEGRANAAVVDLIARAAGVARSAVSVVAGERSRDKLVRVAGVSAAALRARLGA